MISQGPWYALAAPSKQAVRTSVVCVGSRPVLLPPWLGHGGTRSILTTGQIGVIASSATVSVGHSVRCPTCAHASRVQAQRWRSSTCPVSSLTQSTTTSWWTSRPIERCREQAACACTCLSPSRPRDEGTGAPPRASAWAMTHGPLRARSATGGAAGWSERLTDAESIRKTTGPKVHAPSLSGSMTPYGLALVPVSP